MGLFSFVLYTSGFVSSSSRLSSSSSSQQSTSSSCRLHMTTTADTTTLDIINNEWLQMTLQHHDLQIAHFPNGCETTAGNCCRGIQTLRHRPAGELLLSIPSSHILFPQKCWNEYPHIQRAVEKTEKEIMTIHEGVSFNSQILTLALGILQLRQEQKGNDSSYSPLLCTLPKQQYSVSLMPDNIKECLPPTFYRSFTRIQQLHNHVYEIIYKSLQDEQQQVESSSSSLLLLQPPSKRDFLWAVASVQSRSFNADISTSSSSSWRILLPGIDLINHKFGNQASLNYNADLKQYELKSQVAFQAHDEITYSYGQEIDNFALLTNFGFCIPNNPQCLLFFDLDNILDAAQCLIPNIYLDTVITMFKTQLKQQQQYKNKLSSLLLAYDGNQQVPQPDLVQATLMVQALGEQLVEQSLTGLNTALIQHMLIQRKVDLQDSLERLLLLNDVDDDNDDDDDKNWQPFITSIRILLQDELQTLNHHHLL